jgi:hypothetical protein
MTLKLFHCFDSLPSHAERSQWIQLISEERALAETEPFENKRLRLTELALQLREQAQMAGHVPGPKRELPPCFAPGRLKHARHPSRSANFPARKYARTKSKFRHRQVDAPAPPRVIRLPNPCIPSHCTLLSKCGKHQFRTTWFFNTGHCSLGFELRLIVEWRHTASS